MSRGLVQVISKDPLWRKFLYDFILWYWKAFRLPSVKALGHKHFEGKLQLTGVVFTTSRYRPGPHAFPCQIDQFTRKIYGVLRRLQQYSS